MNQSGTRHARDANISGNTTNLGDLLRLTGVNRPFKRGWLIIGYKNLEIDCSKNKENSKTYWFSLFFLYFSDLFSQIFSEFYSCSWSSNISPKNVSKNKKNVPKSAKNVPKMSQKCPPNFPKNAKKYQKCQIISL